MYTLHKYLYNINNIFWDIYFVKHNIKYDKYAWGFSTNCIIFIILIFLQNLEVVTAISDTFKFKVNI